MIGHERGQSHKDPCEDETYLGSTTGCSVKLAPHVKQSLRISIDLEEKCTV
jgi:hypothetical protein